MRIVTPDTYPVFKPSHVLPDPITFMSVPVAVDTETSGLFVDDGDRVCAVSVAYRIDPDTIEYWAFPFDVGRAEEKGFTVVRYSDKAKKDLRGKPKGDPHGRWDWDDNVNLDRREWDFLMDWLAEAGRLRGLSGQNIGFDTHMLRAGTRHFPGVELDEYVRWDTMLASARIWPSEKTTSLKPTAARLYGEQEVAEAAEVAECLAEVKKRYGLTASDGPRYDLMPWDVNGPYAAQDAALTLRLTEDQIDLVEEGLANGTDVYRDLLLGRVLHNIERRGLGPYRVDESGEVANQINERLMVLGRLLPFSPPTPTKARAWFFETLGAKPWGPGEKAHVLVEGKVFQPGTLTVHTAERMAAAGIEGAAEYAEYLRLSSANRMFYRNYADLVGPDNRLRTSFRQAYVKSGRMSVQRFQAQALPKRLGAVMDGQPLPEPRSLFDVDPGKTRVNLDLNQAELRIAARLADCAPMVKTLSQFGDVHGMVCKQVFGIEPGHPEWKDKRDIAKRVNFGAVFGIGPRTFQTTVYDGTGTVMDLGEIKAILDAYRESYPEFAREYSKWEQFATIHRYVPLIRGVSHFRSDDWPRTGWSRRVQGSLAVFVREWLIAIEDLTRDSESLVGTVHDSVVLDLPVDEAESTVKAIGMVTADLWEDLFDIPGGCEPSDWVTGKDWVPPSD